MEMFNPKNMEMKVSLFMRTMVFIMTILSAVIPAMAGSRLVSRPQWVSKGESSLNSHRTNNTYYFKAIKTAGDNLQILKEQSIKSLADAIGKRNQLTGMVQTDMESQVADGTISEHETFRMTFQNSFETESFYASMVDDYWEYVSLPSGQQECRYYALYAVSERGVQPIFDHFEKTGSYGTGAALMSVIPGAGQLYKGQKIKGFAMLGAATLCVGGIVLCENRRSYYQTRIIEQPKFARDYSQKSDNWETGRNVAIGATTALVIWSVIDAATTSGVTRIKVTPSTTLGIRPTAFFTTEGTHLGATFIVSL